MIQITNWQIPVAKETTVTSGQKQGKRIAIYNFFQQGHILNILTAKQLEPFLNSDYLNIYFVMTCISFFSKQQFLLLIVSLHFYSYECE